MEKQFITCVYANCTSDDWQGYQESGEIMVASGKGITEKESLDNAMIEFEKEMKIPETDSSFAVKVEDIKRKKKLWLMFHRPIKKNFQSV